MSNSTRRSFLNHLGKFSAATALAGLTQPAWSRNLHRALTDIQNTPPDATASDEEFWYYVQQAYTVSPSLINLNNGGVAPSPKTVQDAMKRLHGLTPD